MRKYWIDYLRVTAIVAVITIHVTGHYCSKFGEISYLDWWLANIFHSAAMFAVPVFIAISGILCLGNKISITQFYRKRALRLIPPFIFWNIFYFVFLDNGFNPVPMINTLIVHGSTYIHLWYLSTFICMTIFVPFINMPFSGDSFKKKDLVLLIIVLLVFISYRNFASLVHNLRGININWFKSFPWFFTYLIMGYFVNRYEKDIKISSRTLILSLISVVSLGSFLNYYFAVNFGIMIKDGFVFEDISPMVFIITAMILLLFKKNEERFKNSNIIMSISDASFGIYLIHPFYLNITRRLFARYEVNNVISMLLSVLIVFITSLITIKIIRKIKYVRAVC